MTLTTIDALDEEIRSRFERRTGSMEAFLEDWIRLDESQDKLFKARGDKGENYFQHILEKADVLMGLALANMCKFFADTTSAELVMEFLNQHDSKGNDIWHYLAGALAAREEEETLEIANILIQLEIDFLRKNDDDESALSRLLLPEVKWLSINSMNAAKELTLSDVERCFPDRIGKNLEIRSEVMNGIFGSDLENNDGQFTRMVMTQGMQPSAEHELKMHTLKVIFEQIGGSRRENVFMKIVESGHEKIFARAMQLMTQVSEWEARDAMARDLAVGQAMQQQFIYRRLAVKSRGGQNALTKAVMKNRAKYAAHIMSMLKNEIQMKVYKDESGRTQQEEVLIDPDSPAPGNPLLSMLLTQDIRGNTVYHTATILSRVDCLRKLFTGLSFMDSYMIVARIPNKSGVTVKDFLNSDACIGKLRVAVRAGVCSNDEGKQMVAMSRRIHRDVRDFLDELIKRAEEVFERTGGLSEAKPTFDLTRMRTVVDAMKLHGNI